jgi:hypothetical protein
MNHFCDDQYFLVPFVFVSSFVDVSSSSVVVSMLVDIAFRSSVERTCGHVFGVVVTYLLLLVFADLSHSLD